MSEIDPPIRTKDAAAILGENVTQFLRIMSREGIKPVVQIPGPRGAKFWNRADVLPLTPLTLHVRPVDDPPVSAGRTPPSMNTQILPVLCSAPEQSGGAIMLPSASATQVPQPSNGFPPDI